MPWRLFILNSAEVRRLFEGRVYKFRYISWLALYLTQTFTILHYSVHMQVSLAKNLILAFFCCTLTMAYLPMPFTAHALVRGVYFTRAWYLCGVYSRKYGILRDDYFVSYRRCLFIVEFVSWYWSQTSYPCTLFSLAGRLYGPYY